MPAERRFDGWTLVVGIGLTQLAVVSTALLLDGSGEEGLRTGIRWTARSACLLLLPVFAASSLNTVWRSTASKWLLRNRRYLGLGLALAMAVHLGLIATLARAAPVSFRRGLAASTVAGGGVGYLMLTLMVVTSFDRAAGWLGRAHWRRLHVAGMYLLWGIFVFSYVPRAVVAPAYVLLVAPLAAVLGLRVTAWWRRRQR
jgi:DMSO/TMAO reductase YedYZ heme-binding membrane subunit